MLTHGNQCCCPNFAHVPVLYCCCTWQGYCSPLNILRGNCQKWKKCAAQNPHRVGTNDSAYFIFWGHTGPAVQFAYNWHANHNGLFFCTFLSIFHELQLELDIQFKNSRKKSKHNTNPERDIYIYLYKNWLNFHFFDFTFTLNVNLYFRTIFILEFSQSAQYWHSSLK